MTAPFFRICALNRGTVVEYASISGAGNTMCCQALAALKEVGHTLFRSPLSSPCWATPSSVRPSPLLVTPHSWICCECEGTRLIHAALDQCAVDLDGLGCEAWATDPLSDALPRSRFRHPEELPWLLHREGRCTCKGRILVPASSLYRGMLRFACRSSLLVTSNVLSRLIPVMKVQVVEYLEGQGTGKMLVVTGPAGCGKSALLAMAKEREMHLHRLRCCVDAWTRCDTRPGLGMGHGVQVCWTVKRWIQEALALRA